MRSKCLTEISTRKCDELEAKLAELKSSAAHVFSQGTEQAKEKVSWECENYTFYLKTPRSPLRSLHPSQP